jgi:hypothetical protein
VGIGAESREVATLAVVEQARRTSVLSSPAGLREDPMRSILLYLLGVPIPIILLLALCTHHF